MRKKQQLLLDVLYCRFQYTHNENVLEYLLARKLDCVIIASEREVAAQMEK